MPTPSINVEEATVHPRVSQSMDDIIGYEDLVDKGYAYEVDGMFTSVPESLKGRETFRSKY